MLPSHYIIQSIIKHVNDIIPLLTNLALFPFDLRTKKLVTQGKKLAHNTKLKGYIFISYGLRNEHEDDLDTSH